MLMRDGDTTEDDVNHLWGGGGGGSVRVGGVGEGIIIVSCSSLLSIFFIFIF